MTKRTDIALFSTGWLTDTDNVRLHTDGSIKSPVKPTGSSCGRIFGIPLHTNILRCIAPQSKGGNQI